MTDHTTRCAAGNHKLAKTMVWPHRVTYTCQREDCFFSQTVDRPDVDVPPTLSAEERARRAALDKLRRTINDLSGDLQRLVEKL